MKTRNLDCIVVGDLCWDVIVKIRGGVDLTYGGTAYCEFAGLFPGGSANIAAGLSFLGGNAALVGKVGKDRLGKLCLEDLKRNKILPRIFIDNALPTGLITVFVDNRGERSCIVSRGANDNLSPEEITTVSDLMRQSKYLYITGYSLVNSPQRDAVLLAAEMAEKLDAKIVFDPAAYNLVTSKQDIFNKLLRLCDIICPNLEEAKAITGIGDVDNIVSDLRGSFSVLALKLGSKGCVLADKSTVIKIPGSRVSCIDSTGAGDAFVAALIYGLSRGFKLETIGKFANWFAARVVRRFGPRAFPVRSSLTSFMARMTE